MKTRSEVQAQIRNNAEISAAVAKTYIGHVDQIPRHHLLSCNHIARTVAYRLNEIQDDDLLSEDPERIIDILDEDGKTRQYTAKKIQTEHKGLVCFILKPSVDSMEDSIEINHRVHVVFRGTKDIDAWKRNIHDISPGSKAIKESIGTTANELTRSITTPNSHLIISGHSLGGADAQNFFALIMNAIAHAHSESDQSSSLQNISEITLNAANPAGIPEMSAYNADRDAKYLSEKGLKINCMYVLAAGDIVPQSGHAHALAGCEYSVAKVYLTKFSNMLHENYLSGKNISAVSVGATLMGYLSPAFGIALLGYGAYDTVQAHKSKITIEQLLEGSFDLYSNALPEGQRIISEKLGKHILDNGLIDSGRSMLNSFMIVNSDSRSSSPDSFPSQALDEWVIVNRGEFRDDVIKKFTKQKPKSE